MPTFLDLLPEDIRDNISKGYCNPYLDYSDESTESITCYDGQTGNELFTNKMPGSRRVSRQKLRGVLAEGLDIRWGKELISINSDDDDSSGPVKLVFADGDVIEADYVLGTDGPGSKVRRLLFPGREEDSKLVNSGFMIATGVVKYEDREKVEKIVEAHPVAAITMSTDTVMGFGGRLSCLFHPIFTENVLTFSTTNSHERRQPPRQINMVNLLGQDLARHRSGSPRRASRPRSSRVHQTEHHWSCRTLPVIYRLDTCGQPLRHRRDEVLGACSIQ